MAGVYLRIYKYFFDKKIDRKIRKGKSIAGRRINRMSKKYYTLTEKFILLEKKLAIAFRHRYK